MVGRKKWKMDEWRGMRWMEGRNGKWMSGKRNTF